MTAKCGTRTWVLYLWERAMPAIFFARMARSHKSQP